MTTREGGEYGMTIKKVDSVHPSVQVYKHA
jgi:hypothetical protein